MQIFGGELQPDSLTGVSNWLYRQMSELFREWRLDEWFWAELLQQALMLHPDCLSVRIQPVRFVTIYFQQFFCFLNWLLNAFLMFWADKIGSIMENLYWSFECTFQEISPVRQMSLHVPVAVAFPATLSAMVRMTAVILLMRWRVLHPPALPTSSSVETHPASRPAGSVTTMSTVR